MLYIWIETRKFAATWWIEYNFNGLPKNYDQHGWRQDIRHFGEIGYISPNREYNRVGFFWTCLGLYMIPKKNKSWNTCDFFIKWIFYRSRLLSPICKNIWFIIFFFAVIYYFLTFIVNKNNLIGVINLVLFYYNLYKTNNYSLCIIVFEYIYKKYK